MGRGRLRRRAVLRVTEPGESIFRFAASAESQGYEKAIVGRWRDEPFAQMWPLT